MLQSFSSIVNKMESVLSKVPISFNAVVFGTSPKGIKNQMGIPDFIIKDNSVTPLVYMYKNEVLNNRIISQFHFIEDKYIYSARTFVGYGEGWKSTIILAFYKKYLCDSLLHPPQNMQVLSNKSVCIVDKTGNKLILVNDVFLHVIYVSAHTDISKLLLELQLKETRKKQDKINFVQKILQKHL
jgi:hypothetical protein